MLDTSRLIDTPEGVHLQVAPAGPVVRTLAYGVDLAIRALVFLVLSTAIGWAGEFGVGLALLSAFLLEWIYPVLFEVAGDGATPGKRLYRLRVVHENGAPVSWTGSLVRNLLRAVDFLPFAYGFGLLSMLLDGRFRRLGDLAAGTLVVYSGAPTRGRQPAADLPDVAPLPPPWRLTPEEQGALVAFAERAHTLNEARAAEIAAALAPLGDGDVHTLHRHAAWIRGAR